MDPRQLRPGVDFYEQMGLALNLEEVDRGEEGYVSPDEAQRRSMAAKAALRLSAGGQGDDPLQDGALSATLQGDEASWFEQYRMLLDNGWPWRVACYIAWEASPRIRRWPKTQHELATQVLGLTGARAIATWRKRNPNIDEVIATMQAAPLMEHRADILNALWQAASDKDHRNNPDRKLALEMMGDYVPKAKVDISRGSDLDDLATLSEEELKRMAMGSDRRSGVSGQPEEEA